MNWEHLGPRSFRLLTPPMAALRGCVAVTLLIACLLGTGCRRERRTSDFRRTHTELTGAEHFRRGMEMLRSIAEFDTKQAMAQVAYHMNRWIAEQELPADWVREPMLSDGSLGDLRRLPSLGQLDRRDLTLDDVDYLREARWHRDIANWVREQEPPPEVAAWAESQTDKMDADALRQLLTATKLFDWTTRNVQLDAFPNIKPAKPVALPPAEAIPGPGYTLYPWQVLLYGHGDAWQRARVFIALLRQLDIDAVMLGTARDDQSVTPWCVGVLVGDDVYLFDPALGLALPAAHDEGVATLAEWLDQPERCRQLDVGGLFRYPIETKDLTRLVALIDASSEALSQRMRMIESRLTGEERMRLSVDAGRIKRRIARHPGISKVQLWDIPLATELFTSAFEITSELAERTPEHRAWELNYRIEQQTFQIRPTLEQARQLHFRRMFDRTDEKPGAVRLYMDLRVPDAEIDQLATDVELQKLLHVQKQAAETEMAFAARLAQFQFVMRLCKQYSSYYLGLVHYENGDYESAINWFDRRTLQEAPESRWVAGARYNLGRSYEALGQFVEARRQYLLDQSPQRHGNLLRARWIRTQRLKEPDDSTEDPPPTEALSPNGTNPSSAQP